MADFNPYQQAVEQWPDAIPYIMEGQVVDTNDPNQMGRVRVWIPALDGETFDIPDIPWADYVSPFGGFTVSYPAGEGTIPNQSHAAYGFWAIPKVGSTVCVFCMNGSPQSRCYFAATLRLHRNRSLPAGRNTDLNGHIGPWGDAGTGGNLNPIQPAYDNLRTQFNNNVTASEAQTRGAYERQVAQGSNNRDGSEGYSTNPADSSYLDPQTYCLITPGRAGIIIQDDPHFSRLRMKTAEGTQVIFDDANERIYISSAKGNTWFEMDWDGHINVFGSSSFSVRSGADINFTADGNINMEAEKGVNIIANGGDVRVSTAQDFQVTATQDIIQTACGIFDMTAEGDAHFTALGDMALYSQQTLYGTGGAGVQLYSGASFAMTAENDINMGGDTAVIGGTEGVDIGSTAGDITISGQIINLNSGDAAAPAQAAAADQATCAEAATGPSVVPGFEPWARPISDITRGPYWKP